MRLCLLATLLGLSQVAWSKNPLAAQTLPGTNSGINMSLDLRTLSQAKDEIFD